MDVLPRFSVAQKTTEIAVAEMAEGARRGLAAMGGHVGVFGINGVEIVEGEAEAFGLPVHEITPIGTATQIDDLNAHAAPRVRFPTQSLDGAITPDQGHQIPKYFT